MTEHSPTMVSEALKNDGIGLCQSAAKLMRADGSPADAPSPELARRMQEVVWEVVSTNPLTGL